MIDLIPSVIDRLMKLIEARAARKRQLFEDHVDPIYSDLKIVFKYYRETIEHISLMIQDSDFSADRVVDKLRELRSTNVDFRKDVHRYLAVLIDKKGMKDKELLEFASSCAELLFCEPSSSGVVQIISRRSRLHGLVEDLTIYLNTTTAHRLSYFSFFFRCEM